MAGRGLSCWEILLDARGSVDLHGWSVLPEWQYRANCLSRWLVLRRCRTIFRGRRLSCWELLPDSRDNVQLHTRSILPEWQRRASGLSKWLLLCRSRAIIGGGLSCWELLPDSRHKAGVRCGEFLRRSQHVSPISYILGACSQGREAVVLE